MKASIEISDIKREWNLLRSNMTLLTLKATSKLMQLPGLEKPRPSLSMPKPGQKKVKIQIVNDFINEEKLEKLKNDNKKEEKILLKLNEEINLLYVVNIKDIAKHFGRTKGAVLARIRKLELVELYG